MIFKGAARDITEPLVVEEVTALMRYATENGIDKKASKSTAEDSSNTLLTELNDALVAHNDATDDERPGKRGALLRLYTELARQTAPVHGRSLLDTARANWILAKLVLVTVVLMLLVVAELVLGHWLANSVTPEEGWLRAVKVVQHDVLSVIAPFIWGSLGACVYLLKSLYDIARERCFDYQKLRGWYLRVLIGGVLAYVIVQLFDLRMIDGGRAEVDANAIAFLVGLGVKIVYGAIEKLVESVAEKLNLSSMRRNRTQLSEVRTFLNYKISELTDAGEARRAEMYSAVIQDLSTEQVEKK